MTITQEKSALRALARERRRAARANLGAAAGEAIRDAFLRVVAPETKPGGAVAGYWPMRDEADVGPLMAALHGRGVVCALPVVVERGKPLLFRRWSPGMALEPGVYGERIPGEQAQPVTPATILAPLLAFDRAGRRLGYGGGYYDRTIDSLRRRGAVLAVGVALSVQEVDAVPHGPEDHALDWVVTEREAIEIGAPPDSG